MKPPYNPPPYPLNHSPCWYRMWSLLVFLGYSSVLIPTISRIPGQPIIASVVFALIFGFILTASTRYVYYGDPRGIFEYMRLGHPTKPRVPDLHVIHAGMLAAVVAKDPAMFHESYRDAWAYFRALDDSRDSLQPYFGLFLPRNWLQNPDLNPHYQRQKMDQYLGSRIKDLDVITAFMANASNDLRNEIDYAVSSPKWDPLFTVFDRQALTSYVVKQS